MRPPCLSTQCPARATAARHRSPAVADHAGDSRCSAGPNPQVDCTAVPPWGLQTFRGIEGVVIDNTRLVDYSNNLRDAYHACRNIDAYLGDSACTSDDDNSARCEACRAALDTWFFEEAMVACPNDDLPGDFSPEICLFETTPVSIAIENDCIPTRGGRPSSVNKWAQIGYTTSFQSCARLAARLAPPHMYSCVPDSQENDFNGDYCGPSVGGGASWNPSNGECSLLWRWTVEDYSALPTDMYPNGEA